MNTRNLGLGFLLLCLVTILVLVSPFLAGETLSPADTIKSMPMSKYGFDQLVEQKRIVQWIPYLFGGMPCYGSVMVTPSYLVSVLFTWILGPLIGIFKDPVMQHIAHLLLFSAGSLLFLRRRGVGWPGAAFAAFNIMLATSFVGLMGAGHTIKLWTICWMPLNLYWLDRLLEERRWKLLLPASLCLGLMLSAKHIQMSWYFLIFAGLYTVIRLLWPEEATEPRIRVRMGSLALGWVVLGLGLAAYLYLPVLDYSGMSMRASATAGVGGEAYAAAYSYPAGDLLSWLLPEAKGFGGGSYFGKLEYTAFPLYMGALWLPLLLPALLDARRRRQLLPLLIPGLLLLLIGMGKHSPFFELFQAVLPGYAKFRAHMWALALSQIVLLLGAGMGLDVLLGWLRDWKQERVSPLLRGLLLGGLGCLAVAILVRAAAPSGQEPLAAGTSFSNAQDSQRVQYMYYQQGIRPNALQVQQGVNMLRASRAHAFWTDASRVLLIMGLAAGLVWLLGNGRIKQLPFAALLLLLIAVDLIPVDKRTMSFEPARSPATHFRARGALAELAAMPDKHEFRVWPNGTYSFNELSWHGLHSIEGYHGAKPAGIQRVLAEGRVRMQGDEGPIESLHPVWLDLLNVEWILSRAPLPGFPVAGRHADGVLQRNPEALPRISFPPEVRVTPGEEQFEAVMEGLDPAQTVLVDAEGLALPGRAAAATGRITHFDAEEIKYELEATGPTLALLSEIWLPRGWEAELNGQPARILRADHLLRAVWIAEAGQHSLVLRYRPAAWRQGVWITLITLLVLVAIGVVSGRKPASADPDGRKSVEPAAG